ncbi:MAG: ATP-binding protein [Deltaproteobacteria bacterium]|nr:MAG: ATP-binding protein [Deltaproteobacteria bacterium]
MCRAPPLPPLPFCIIIQVMNDYHSSIEWIYRKRWLSSLLATAVKDHPEVVLTGARQVGKSTLLAYEGPFKDWHRVDLDDLDLLHQAERDPTSLWVGVDQVVIDEVQRAPGILHGIKREVDRDRSRKRFLLSGSANLLLMQRVSESLAGRAVYFVLLPMSLGEMKGRGHPSWFFDLFKGKAPSFSAPFPSEDPIKVMLRGFMPPLLFLEGLEAWIKWWEGYVATYIERDLRQLSQIDSLSNFRAVMEHLSLRTGQVLNQTEVARDSGVSQPTVHRYTTLLEVSHLLYRLPAFYRSRSKRLIKSPKVYWLDPALPSFLMGLHEQEALFQAREVGALFENLVFLHLQALVQLLVPRPRLYYWRTVTGREVDFVIEWGRRLVAVEVKFTESPRYDDAATLRLFLEEYPETAFCLLIHRGTEVRFLHEKILALPWEALCEEPGNDLP